MQKAKRVVIKEEFIEITGDFKLAIVLNQMIYWSERVSDFDKFIKEEKQRQTVENQEFAIDLQNGWIYKKANELAEECMITNSEATMRRYLDKLVEFGFLNTRRNPKYRWDKTLQYRVDLRKIQQVLMSKGYVLENYRFDGSNFQNENTDFQNDGSNFHDERAIPEITSREEEEDARINFGHITNFYEQNGFGIIGAHISQKMGMWCDDLSAALVLEAMKIAVERGAKSWSYIESVLINWDDKNIKTVLEAKALILERQNKINQSRGFQEKKAPAGRDIPNFVDDFSIGEDGA